MKNRIYWIITGLIIFGWALMTLHLYGCTSHKVDMSNNFDTEKCNFQTPCRSVTLFKPGLPMGDCDPRCSYAIQDFLECDSDMECRPDCEAENDAVIEACPTWNFYSEIAR